MRSLGGIVGRRGRIEKPEDAAEGVVARRTAFERQKFAPLVLLGSGEIRHVDAALRPAQGRAQRDEQDLQKVVPQPVAASRILDPLERRPKPPHRRRLLRKKEATTESPG